MKTSIAIVVGLLVVAVVTYSIAALEGLLGHLEAPGTIATQRLPEAWITGERTAREKAARAKNSGKASVADFSSS